MKSCSPTAHIELVLLGHVKELGLESEESRAGGSITIGGANCIIGPPSEGGDFGDSLMPLSTADLFLRATRYIVGLGQGGLKRRRGMF